MNQETALFSVAHELVYELKVKDALRDELITVTPRQTLREVQHLLRDHRISGVPVLEDGKLVGIVSIEDIIGALDHHHIEEQVGKWMTRKVVTIPPNVPLSRAVAMFFHYRYGRLPVLDRSRELIGIITPSDIINRLMVELNKLADQSARREVESMARVGTFTDQQETTVIEVDIRAGDFDSAGIASARIKKELTQRGILPEVIRRAAIATYEAETNIIIHSIGGKVSVCLSPERLEIKATDYGPGIEDLNLAMKKGFSTAGELVRALGFGAGMGLPNIKKCSDEFEIQSEPDKGTELRIVIHLEKVEVTADATQPVD